jgi:hypothetical protein
MRVILKWFNKWGLFIISITVIVLYIVINSDISNQQDLNKSVLTNILFTIINLLSAFYISRKVSLWGWQTETTTNQKRLAKTAIRHNNGNLASILKLIKITKENREKVENELSRQYMQEIQNHLEVLYNGLKNAEADFHEIVNEELKEQNVLEFEISNLFNEIEVKTQKLLELTQISGDKDNEISSLKKQLMEKELELNNKVSSLPFGSSSLNALTAYDYLRATRANVSTNNKLSFRDLIGLNKDAIPEKDKLRTKIITKPNNS